MRPEHWLYTIPLRFRSLFRRAQTDQDLDDELRDHVEQKTEDYICKGLAPKEARRRALVELRGLERTKEACRDTRRVRWLQDFGQDIRYATRMLRKAPGFTTVAILTLTLALGIGATTTVFSVIYNALVAPFPYKGADRLTTVTIHDDTQAGKRGRSDFTISEFLDYRKQNNIFEDMVGSYDLDVLYRSKDDTRIFPGAYVTANAFDFFGVPALLGRGLTLADGKPGAPPVFVMNYKIWKGQFNGNPKIVGTAFVLNGKPRTLVGIMPPRFQAYGMRIWLPLGLSPGAAETARLRNIHLWVIGRLKRRMSLSRAAAALNTVAHRIARIYPKDYPKQFSVMVTNVQEFMIGKFKTTLYALVGAVAMLLLIACSNVANLLLARATVRGRETSIRLAMGATRVRLVKQMFVESFALASVAGVVGCFLAYFGLKGIVAIIPMVAIADEAVIGLNPVVLLFAVGVTMFTTLLCGLAPAFHALHKDLSVQLAGTGKGAGGGFQHGRFRSALVAAEVALSIVLLVGAGLLMRSFVALTHVNLGVNPTTILYAQLALPNGRYDTAQQRKLLIESVLQRVKALPGVEAASESSSIPVAGDPTSDINILGITHSERWPTAYVMCGVGYFRTLGLRTIGGRLLSDAEVDSARGVAVVNETLVRRYFGHADPIGQQIQLKALEGQMHNRYFQVVGVVSDFRNQGPDQPPLPEVFIPYTLASGGSPTILVKSGVNPNLLTSDVRQDVRTADANVAVSSTGTVESYLQEVSYTEPQFGFIAMGAFALTALVLVAIGTFSVMAYSVSLQTHDFGVRMALGAQQGDVLKMVLLQGARLAAAGIFLGILASVGLARLIASQIWGISETDPATLLGVVVLVATVAIAASYIPARRAMRVDPLAALRYE